MNFYKKNLTDIPENVSHVYVSPSVSIAVDLSEDRNKKVHIGVGTDLWLRTGGWYVSSNGSFLAKS